MSQRLYNGYDYTKYTRGTVVRDSSTDDIGHIVGFDRVYYEYGYETILKVMWDDGQVRSIHPRNAHLFC